jgi:hypothetical protein
VTGSLERGTGVLNVEYICCEMMKDVTMLRRYFVRCTFSAVVEEEEDVVCCSGLWGWAWI